MLGQQLEEREVMHGLVYDELIKAILCIIHKLDLSSIKDSSSTLEVMLVDKKVIKIDYECMP